MTVADLIAKLQTMPQDAPVVCSLFSEYGDMGELFEDCPRMEQMILRNGTYMRFRKQWWDYAKDGQPQLIDVCYFDGN